MDGSEVPIWRAIRPFFILGATSNSADKNWLDALASITNSPPGISPLPCKTIGKL